MTGPLIRVVKVGGSLFDCEQFPRLLTDWLAQPTHCRACDAGKPQPTINVMIAGGGNLVDHIRQLDRRFELSAKTAHWMSINAMSATARLLSHLVGTDEPTLSWEALQSRLLERSSHPIVFDVHQWLLDVEPGQAGVRLSHDWRTTSDSISARLACVLAADELALLKSIDAPPKNDWRFAADHNMVDAFFPEVATDVAHITWVNLRNTKRPTLPTRS